MSIGSGSIVLTVAVVMFYVTRAFIKLNFCNQDRASRRFYSGDG